MTREPNDFLRAMTAGGREWDVTRTPTGIEFNAKSAVPQPQDAASGASQGNVEREKGAEEAKPAYLVRFINRDLLEAVLNNWARDSYEPHMALTDPEFPRSYVVILRRRD